MQNQRGNPVMTLRLPEWQIDALKTVAREEGTTVSEILRGYVAACLDEHGITEPGQSDA